MITQEIVRAKFAYEDGSLIRKSHARGPVRAGMIAGCINGCGYRQINFCNKTYLEHRIVFLWHHGYMPKFIDHINRDKLDNHIENLREVTSAENKWNVPASGAFRSKGKWGAQIRVYGYGKGKIHLGTFSTKAEAEAAYLAAKGKYHRVGGAPACSP